MGNKINFILLTLMLALCRLSYSAESAAPYYRDPPTTLGINATHLAPEGNIESEATARVFLDNLRIYANENNLNLAKQTIVVIHRGERIPKEMRWLIGHLKQAGLTVRLIKKNPDTLNSSKEEEIAKEIAKSKLLLTLKHDIANSTKSGLTPFVSEKIISERFAFSLFEKSLIHLKRFFGLHNGISIGMFSDSTNGIHRPVKEKWIETLGGFSLGALLATISSITLKAEVTANPDLFPYYGILSAALFQILWAYTDRAYNAFQSQGKVYYNDRGAIEMNRPWFMFCAFTHSMISSLWVQTATHGLFGMSLELFGRATYNSLLALGAKVLPKMLIAKKQDMGEGSPTRGPRHSPYQTITLSLITATFYETLKLGHLLDWGAVFTDSFFVLAGAGVFYEVYQHFFSKNPLTSFNQGIETIKKRLLKDFKTLGAKLGARKETQCKTLLMIRPKVNKFEADAL